MNGDAAIPANPIVIQQFCQRHQHELIVRRLHLAEHEPWMATMVTAQLLCFGWLCGEGRIWKRAGADDPASLSIALAEVGCMACFDRDAFRRAVLVLKKGLDHAALVAQHKAKDPDWPIEQFTKRDA